VGEFALLLFFQNIEPVRRLQVRGDWVMGTIAKTLWRLFFAAIGLTVLSTIVHLLLGMRVETRALGWLLLSNLLIVLILSYLARRSRFSGLRLAVILFLVFFGIHTVNTQIESIFFQLAIPQEEMARIVFAGFLVALFFSPVIVVIMGKMGSFPQKTQTRERAKLSLTSWIWRIALCDFIYVFLYIVAGALVFPYVRDFYANFTMPPPSQIILMQLVRGLVYIGLGLLTVWMLAERPLEVAVAVGFSFSILGGLAPLLLPNPYMPAHIRIAHGFEISISNFLYGGIVGYLFGSKMWHRRPVSRER